MERVVNYLNNLSKNNHKAWFDTHKKEFLEAQTVFNDFVDRLLKGISEFDPQVKNLTVKDCTYRIYRDVRFSNDKTPYKSHMGAFISPHGKNSGYSGYYFHIEATGANYIGGHILSTGIYRPAPKVLKSIREEIMLNGEKFLEAVSVAKGFNLDSGDALKRVPSGFPADSQFAEFFKLRNYFLVKYIDNNFLFSNNLLENTILEYKKTLLFNNLLNTCVDYSNNIE
ncbi:MAG: hypothetical protein A2266_07225 [Bacteroidetes bacterium RIFOXYA12_FULL_40_10]|nr:MAG: hypothetical protein A2266_07225 [Bacteroidetes bacterium RIFOXYA12_FULL_40_10]